MSGASHEHERASGYPCAASTRSSERDRVRHRRRRRLRSARSGRAPSASLTVRNAGRRANEQCTEAHRRRSVTCSARADRIRVRVVETRCDAHALRPLVDRLLAGHPAELTTLSISNDCSGVTSV
jgi:hypothetical protein